MRFADSIASTGGAGELPDVLAATSGEHARHNHTVQFYEDDAYLADAVASFLAPGLRDQQPAVVIATESHRRRFTAALRSRGVDVDAASARGLLSMVDARTMLEHFMVDAVPDAARFRDTIGPIIEASRDRGRHRSVRAYGEMVDLLWTDGNAPAAIRLEAMWNELASSYEFSLLCAYAMGGFAEASHADAFRTICDSHSVVLPTERYMIGSDDAARLAEVTLLQQRAKALETEMRRRAELETQLLSTVKSLREREEELRDVLENAAEGIHWVGADGKILWANRAELDMLGYAPDEYIGHHIAEFHVDGPVVDDMLARLAHGETLSEYEARVRRKDSSIRDVLVTSNVLWRDGQFVHTRCFTRDITELKRVSAERDRSFELERAARADAERANRAKSEFLAVMSHELRTPLNAIGGYVELIELGIQGPVSAQQHESLERIQRSQRHLLGLINQVLNHAQVETGRAHYDIADVAIDELLRTAETLLLPQARAKGIDYRYAGCDPSLAVRADAQKVQQIVLNLLTNATKFTDRNGAIRLECESDGRQAVIRVRDTGIGIPAEKLDAVFDPFVQVDAKYTRNGDGVGLGLTISRDLARGMGGDLTAASTPGAGSTFTLLLPLAGAPA